MAIYCLMHLLATVWLVLVMSAALVRPMPLSKEAQEEALLAQEAIELIGARIQPGFEDDQPAAPSQTVEVRLLHGGKHPQLLTATPDHEGEVQVGRGSGIIGGGSGTGRSFGRRIDVQYQHHVAQQQSNGFGALASGRPRSKDSEGAALRRAVSGTPAAQKLIRQQHSASESVVTPRKISAGFGNNGAAASQTTTKAPSSSSSSSPLRSQQQSATITSDGNLANGGRKENVHFNKNRFAATSAPSAVVVAGGGGDTPASTSSDPTSTQWLFGSHTSANKDGLGGRPKLHQQIDSFRLANGGDRWLQLLGQRAVITTTTTTQMSTTTTEVPTTTTTTTTSTVPVSDISITELGSVDVSSTPQPLNVQVTEQSTMEVEEEVITTPVSPVVAVSPSSAETTTTEEPSTTTTTTASPSTTTTTTMRTTTQSAITPEQVYGLPEINYGTPETVHGKPEEVYGTPELVYGTPETTTASSKAITTTTETSLQNKAIDGLIESFNEKLDNRPLDGAGRPFPSVENVDDDDDDELGASHQELDNDSDAIQEPDEGQKYLVEEKTPDGYIVGEFGVMSPSSGSLRGVRYVAHGSINPQLIKEALRTFLSLRKK